MSSSGFGECPKCGIFTIFALEKHLIMSNYIKVKKKRGDEKQKQK